MPPTEAASIQMPAKPLDDIAQGCRVLLNDLARLLLARHLGRRPIFIKGRFFGRRHRRDGRPGSKGTIELNQKGPVALLAGDAAGQFTRERVVSVDLTDEPRPTLGDLFQGLGLSLTPR
jgi:hypothetical protein